jgi:hypothetical protein
MHGQDIFLFSIISIPALKPSLFYKMVSEVKRPERENVYFHNASSWRDACLIKSQG